VRIDVDLTVADVSDRPARLEESPGRHTLVGIRHGAQDAARWHGIPAC
jgi:hypothetical protein